MKSAFTMIELIFIIVIIGILASVAIPRLAATRDDAKIATIANEIGNTLKEIGAYAVAQGSIANDMTVMSNAAELMIEKGYATQSGSTLQIKIHNVTDCVKVDLPASSVDANVTVSYGAAGSDVMCKELQARVQRGTQVIPLTGSRIKQ